MSQPTSYPDHYRKLITLGVPIIIGQIGMIILGFADTIMIGHHSTEELGAASFVNNLFNLVIIGSTGFSYGLTPVIGQLFGHNDRSAIGGQAQKRPIGQFHCRPRLHTGHDRTVLQHRQPEPACRTHPPDQAVLPRPARLAHLHPAVQRFQAIRRRHHGHEDVHVDSAHRQPDPHRPELRPDLRRGRPARNSASSVRASPPSSRAF